MKKICYLHIGMHKTGSSSIQTNLYRVRDEIERKTGFYYLRHSDENQETELNIDLLVSSALRYISSELDAQQSYAKTHVTPSGKDLYYFNFFKKILIEKEKLIISSEVFSLKPVTFHALLKRTLEAYNFEIKVLLYVRNPYDAFSSRLQQGFKGNVPQREDFLSLIEDYADFWGDALEIRQFERSALYKNDLLSDFVEWLNEPLILGLLPKVSVNESLSLEACIIANLCANKYDYFNRDPNLGYDPVFAYIMRMLDHFSKSTNKFKAPASLVYGNSQRKESFDSHISFLNNYFDKKGTRSYIKYQPLELPEYDINSINSIDEKVLIDIIYNAGKEHHNLVREYHRLNKSIKDEQLEKERLINKNSELIDELQRLKSLLVK